MLDARDVSFCFRILEQLYLHGHMEVSPVAILPLLMDGLYLILHKAAKMYTNSICFFCFFFCVSFVEMG